MVLLLAAACVRRARDMVQAVAAASTGNHIHLDASTSVGSLLQALLKVGHVHVLVPNICK